MRKVLLILLIITISDYCDGQCNGDPSCTNVAQMPTVTTSQPYGPTGFSNPVYTDKGGTQSNKGSNPFLPKSSPAVSPQPDSTTESLSEPSGKSHESSGKPPESSGKSHESSGKSHESSGKPPESSGKPPESSGTSKKPEDHTIQPEERRAIMGEMEKYRKLFMERYQQNDESGNDKAINSKSNIEHTITSSKKNEDIMPSDSAVNANVEGYSAGTQGLYLGFGKKPKEESRCEKCDDYPVVPCLNNVEYKQGKQCLDVISTVNLLYPDKYWCRMREMMWDVYMQVLDCMLGERCHYCY